MAKQTTQKLTRAQIRQGLDTIPIESLLSSGQGKQPKLTTKQRDFAKAVAMGKTKAQAYRESYKVDAAQSTIVCAPYKLAADARIQQEVEAYKIALEAEKHRTPLQLKALLVQQLVQHSLDDDFPPASRVQCLKLLGSLFEVGAFVERKEITTVNRSEDIRTRLLSRLQTITVDADIVADDALDLLAEIRSGKAVVDDGPAAAPTEGASPRSGVAVGAGAIHTIPLKRSELETEIDDFDE
jgi:type III secretion system FlhB-like substrate exporter